MKVLVIEDDALVAQALSTILSTHNYAVEIAHEAQSGLALIESFDYDLIVLDVILPPVKGKTLDGIEVCRQVRSQGYQMPILLLTERNSHHDRAIGLDAGADDYMVKPFDQEELLARMRALLRRVSSTTQPLLEWGDLKLDPSSCGAIYGTTPLTLTPKEYALLELFLRNTHRVFSCSAILDHLWAYEDAPGEDAVRTHIKGLRQKLKAAGAPPDLIETVYGIGYHLKPFLATTQSQSKETDAPLVQQVRSHLDKLWQRSQQQVDQQIRVIEKAAQVNPPLSAGLQQQAEREAHRLAGSLGTFGFAEGSRLAKAIEHLCAQARSLNRQELSQLQEVIAALRRSINIPLSSVSSVSSGSSPLPVLAVTPENEQNLASHILESLSQLTASDSTILLVVDRDRNFTEVLQQAAPERGYSVVSVQTIHSAMRFLAHTLPTAVLLDIDSVAPLQQGLTLLAHCHHQIPPMPTLVFTQHCDLNERLNIIRQGGRLLLQKPIAPAQVFDALEQVVERTSTTQAKVLIVDDDEEILAVLKLLLEPWGLKVVTLTQAQHLLTTLEAYAPDLLILDIELPDISGIELCQILRNDLRWSSLPILFLTAHNDATTVNEVFLVGADDFVSKPIVGPELITRIINRLERMKLTKHLAEIDPLTGVMNSTKSHQELENFLHLAERWQQPLTLAVLDVDRMRQVNDEHGQTTGDGILRQLGAVLRHLFHSEDIVARWGGEEFVVGMYGITQAEGVQRILQVLQIMQQRGYTTAAGTTIPVTFSAGVAQYPQNGTDVRSLYRSAVAALAQAKRSGRNCVLPTA